MTVEIVLKVRKCCHVTQGGRQGSYSVLVAVADPAKHMIGIASGNGLDPTIARGQALRKAKLRMTKILLKDGRTIHYEMIAKAGAGKVWMKPAKAGTGVIAGGVAKKCLEALGVKDIIVKSLGSTTPGNFVRALFRALTNCISPREIAEKRGKRLFEIIGSNKNKDGAYKLSDHKGDADRVVAEKQSI